MEGNEKEEGCKWAGLAADRTQNRLAQEQQQIGRGGRRRRITDGEGRNKKNHNKTQTRGKVQT